MTQSSNVLKLFLSKELLFYVENFIKKASRDKHPKIPNKEQYQIKNILKKNNNPQTYTSETSFSSYVDDSSKIRNQHNNRSKDLI